MEEGKKQKNGLSILIERYRLENLIWSMNTRCWLNDTHLKDEDEAFRLIRIENRRRTL